MKGMIDQLQDKFAKAQQEGQTNPKIVFGDFLRSCQVTLGSFLEDDENQP
jgi:hypothetical protein